MITLTRELIMEVRTPAGAWNRHQLELLGVPCPPEGGWIKRIEGTSISEEKMEEVKRLSTMRAKDRRKEAKNGIPPEENKIDPADKNVAAVRAKMESRMLAGFQKYGVTTERTDLSRKQWLIHAQEEAMDMAVYLEKLIQLEG